MCLHYYFAHILLAMTVELMGFCGFLGAPKKQYSPLRGVIAPIGLYLQCWLSTAPVGAVINRPPQNRLLYNTIAKAANKSPQSFFNL